jgi:hypothetical protein
MALRPAHKARRTVRRESLQRRLEGPGVRSSHLTTEGKGGQWSHEMFVCGTRLGRTPAAAARLSQHPIPLIAPRPPGSNSGGNSLRWSAQAERNSKVRHASRGPIQARSELRRRIGNEAGDLRRDLAGPGCRVARLCRIPAERPYLSGVTQRPGLASTVYLGAQVLEARVDQQRRDSCAGAQSLPDPDGADDVGAGRSPGK